MDVQLWSVKYRQIKPCQTEGMKIVVILVLTKYEIIKNCLFQMQFK